MKVIGVTGGVGAGKSEVLGYIAGNWNATVVEADEVGHLVMRAGTEACYRADCRAVRSGDFKGR